MKKVASPLLFVWLFAVALFTVKMIEPTAKEPSTNPQDFSVDSAFSHLREIARKPHPIGSAEHKIVGAYVENELRKIGLQVEVQATLGATMRPPRAAVAPVRNLIGRIGSPSAAKRILFVSHYDSVPFSHGANDDGVGVASLLEVARIIKDLQLSGVVLKNEFVFLFSDAEEFGLLGAAAFAEDPEQMKNIGLVVNLEARGSSGPSVLFETSGQNGGLLAAYQEAATFPLGSSLISSLYRFLPNDTDVTVFKTHGIPSLNFAYGDHLHHYHTLSDRVENVDPKTLFHQGQQALDLAKYFAVNELPPRSPDRIFFDVLGLFLIQYTSLISWLLMILGLVFSIGLFVAICRSQKVSSQKITGRSIWLGAALTLLEVIVFIALMIFFGSCLRWILEDRVLLAHGRYFLWSSTATVMGLLIWVRCRFFTGPSINTWPGAIIVWSLLAFALQVWAPSISYLGHGILLLTMGAFFGSFLLQPNRKNRSRASTASALTITALSLTGLAVLCFETSLVISILEGGLLPVAAAIFLLPVLQTLSLVESANLRNRRHSHGALLTMILGGTAVVFGLCFFGYNSFVPRVSSLIFAKHQSLPTNLWITPEKFDQTDLKSIFQSVVSSGPRPEVLFTKKSVYSTAAPVLNVGREPEIQLLKEIPHPNEREVHFKIQSKRGARCWSTWQLTQNQVLRTSVNGKEIKTYSKLADLESQLPTFLKKVLLSFPSNWNLSFCSYESVATSVAIHLQTKEKIKLRIVDETPGLPDASGFSRYHQDHGEALTIPSSQGDRTLLGRDYEF